MSASETYLLHGDLLIGAAEIAGFMFGDKAKRRKVYRLARQPGTPIFRQGWEFCVRKSALVRWIANQEADPAAPSYSVIGDE